MLHTKFRGNRSDGSGEDQRPSWFCDPDAANKLSFPLPKEAPHKSWFCLTKWFRRRRSLKNVNGRTTEAGSWVYYKVTW